MTAKGAAEKRAMMAHMQRLQRTAAHVVDSPTVFTPVAAAGGSAPIEVGYWDIR